MTIIVPASVRFHSSYKANGNGCWIWQRAPNGRGYGQIREGRWPAKNFKTHLAHRLSWEIHNGPIPPGLFVCHHCDVRLCVNPAHLFLGTIQDNLRDMREKGRGRLPEPLLGERHPNAKLTAAKVKKIRSLIKSGKTVSSIAKRYGMGRSTITRLKFGTAWSHLK